MPAGYGIQYVPLPSAFARYDFWPNPPEPPKHAVISVTDLCYLHPDNPLVAFRRIEPDTMLAHALLVYRTQRPEVADALRSIRREERVPW